MGFLFSVMGRYVMWRVLAGMGVVFAGVLATILLVDLVEQMRTIGSRVELPLLDALRLTALKAPQIAEQTLPFVMLVGAMLAVMQLNRRSELIAIRASGVSAWRFLGPTAIIAGLIGALSTLALNPAATALYATYEAEKNAIMARGGTIPPGNGVWLRQGDGAGQVVIHGASVDASAARLNGAVFYFFEFDQTGALRFVRRVAAQSADLRAGFWQLNTVVEGQAGKAPVESAYLALPTRIAPGALIDRFVGPSTLSVWRLPGFIEEARAAGVTASRYQLRLHALFAAPLIFMAMAGLGAVFSLRLVRLGGQARWALAGLGCGFLVFFAARVTEAFAAAETLPPALAAWAPPIGACAAVLAILAFVEDE